MLASDACAIATCDTVGKTVMCNTEACAAGLTEAAPWSPDCSSHGALKV